MSAIVAPKAQQLAIIEALVALADYVGAKLHLFSNDLLPDRNTLLADFTECVYTGYAAQTITWSAGFFDPTLLAVSAGGEKLFMQTGATGDTCFGAYLTDTAGTKLLWSARLDDAPFTFVVVDDALPLTLKMGAASGYLERSDGP